MTVPKLKNILDAWVLEYTCALKQYKSDGKLYHFVPEKHLESKDEKKPTRTYRQRDQVSYKTMNNIFFSDKSKILHRLEDFLGSRDEYRRRGVPYNLGFLLHGDPGCGKTSFIKALSNYTQRHIVDINLKTINTCGDFTELFTNEFINNMYIPVDKRIIVLEDIDCMDAELINDRGRTVDDQDNGSHDSLIKYLEKEFKPSCMERYEPQDKLTLSCVLNTIDGTCEQHGRIMIITSNYPERLDRALIRAGRIDCKVHFTKCTNDMMLSIIEHYYNRPGYVRSRLQKTKFLEYQHTPAEVMDACALESDIDKVVDAYAFTMKTLDD